VTPNKQLQRTVQTVSRRGARASFHYARAPRCIGQRAAAELRRYTATEAISSLGRFSKSCIAVESVR
jgi:hypothetical protein